jgi:hypothetical protein
MGIGWKFDGLEEATAISREVHPFFLLAELYYTPNMLEHLSVLKILLPIW